MKIKLNEDKAKVKQIRKALKNNNGYCPNSIMQDNEHKCPCKEFREKESSGYCDCGLYYKTEE